jgi:hypothetical protein
MEAEQAQGGGAPDAGGFAAADLEESFRRRGGRG